MPSFDSPILQDVYDRYVVSIEKEKDRKRFETAFTGVSTLDDVIATVNDTKSNAAKKKSSRLFDKLDRLLELIRENKEVLETLSQINGLIGCSIWGPLKLIVTVVHKSQEAVEKLRNLMDRLAINAHFCKEYEKLHPRDALVKKSLTNFYEDVVHFAAISLDYFKKSNFKHLVRHIGKGAMAPFDDVIEKLTLHGQAVEKASNIAHMKNTQQFQEEIKEGKKESKAKKVREWLNPGHYYEEQQNLQSVGKTDRTCEWFLSHSKFKSWTDPADNNKSKLLWLHGKPGCGKSYLASTAVGHLKNSGQPIYYFYNQKEAREEFHQSAIGFLGAFLFQLFETNSDEVKKIITVAWVKSPDNLKQVSSFDQLQTLLEVCLPHIEGRVMCILDALDECKNMKPLIDCIVKTVQSSDKIRFCVLSRDEAKIRQEFEPVALEIAVQDGNVESDIKRYLERKVGEWDTEKQQKSGILMEIDDLVSRSEGMFLWARLTMDLLSQTPTTAEIKSILRSTPAGLNGMYEFIFSRILHTCNGWKLSVSQKILKWATTASSPIKLAELRVALAIDVGDPEFEEDKLIYETSFRQTVMDAVGPLLDVKVDETIQVVHLTVKEFLFREEKGGFNEFWFAEEEVNADLAGISLTMLSFGRFSAERIAEDYEDAPKFEDGKLDPEPNIFYRYAAENWHSHVIRIDPHNLTISMEMHDAVKTFASCEMSFPWLAAIERELGGAEISALQQKLARWSRSVTKSERSPFERLLVDIARRDYEWHSSQPPSSKQRDKTAISSYILCRRLWYVIEDPRSETEKEECLKEIEKLSSTLLDIIADHPEFDGIDDELAFDVKSTLSRTLRSQNRDGEAEKLELENLHFLKRTLGEDDIETLDSMGRLSVIYADTNRINEAEKFEVEVVKVLERRFGGTYWKLLNAKEALAATYGIQGRHVEAKALLTQVLKARISKSGTDDEMAIKTMSRLGECYGDLSDFEGWQDMAQRVVDAATNLFGPLHRATLDYIQIQGQSYYNQGHQQTFSDEIVLKSLKRAETIFRQLLQTRKSLFPFDDEDLLTNMQLLASTLSRLGTQLFPGESYEACILEAEGLALLVLETRRQKLGPNHRSTLASFHCLAMIYYDGRHFSTVEEIERDVLAEQTKLLGAGHTETGYSRKLLVLALRALGKDVEADKIEKKALRG